MVSTKNLCKPMIYSIMIRNKLWVIDPKESESNEARINECWTNFKKSTSR